MTKRLCLIRHRAFPGDPRIENQIQAAIDSGFETTLICSRGPGQPFYAEYGRAHIYRLPAMKRKRASMLRYAAEYLTFFFTVFFFLTWLHLRRKQDIILALNLPDFLVFTALVPKLLGAKVALDIRECTPELYMSDHHVSDADSLIIKIVVWMEQTSLRFADMGLTCTATMRDKLVERGTQPDKIVVMLNVPDPALFSTPQLPDPHKQPADSFHLITHGTIKERYGHEVLIRAVLQAQESIPGLRLTVAGRGQLQPFLEQLVRDLGLTNRIKFVGFVPNDELMECLRSADCGVVPLLSSPETDVIHTFKMYEYMALGLPAIISRTTAVEQYFTEDCLLYVEPGNPQALAEAIVDLHRNPQLQYDLAVNALAAYQNLAGEKQKLVFHELLDQLVP